MDKRVYRLAHLASNVLKRVNAALARRPQRCGEEGLHVGENGGRRARAVVAARWQLLFVGRKRNSFRAPPVAI